jgi:hypothetical protein
MCLFVVLQLRAHFQLKTKRLKQKGLNVAPFVSQTFELESWKFKELLGFQVLESQREVTMR